MSTRATGFTLRRRVGAPARVPPGPRRTSPAGVRLRVRIFAPVDPHRLRALAHAVEPLARRAGGAILEVYAAADPGAVAKPDGTPVTEADRRSEAVLQAGLAALATGYPIVSEESRRLPYAERAAHDLVWVCDPLDGTKEFLARNGEFCVCVALVERGAPVLGVVHAPVTGVSTVAWRGAGAASVRDAADGPWRVLRRRRPLDADARGLRFCVSRSHLGPATEGYLAAYRDPVAVPMGSALKFCGIAADLVDVYPRHAPTMEWDTAAGQCIVEAAGGEVVDAATGEPLRYNKPDLVNPSFVARAPLAPGGGAPPPGY